jgi:Tfp pilus assembly ATPase PilU
VLELKRLVEKTIESKKKIFKKEVLLFVGNSGTGKSTNLLGFLGYTMKNAFFKGLPTLSPVEAV